MFCPKHTLRLTACLAAALALTPPAAAQSGAPTPTLPTCIARLATLGIKAEPPAALSAPLFAACIIVEPVTLVSAAPRSGDPILFPDRPLLSCVMAEKLSRFSLEVASPMAARAFGKPLALISTGPGYECRPRNRQVGARISSHGQGNAVDILMMELSGGRKIVVEKPDGAAAVTFVAGLRTSACAAFNTVLGPGSDPSHANHIHLDIEPRGKQGNAKFCQ